MIGMVSNRVKMWLRAAADVVMPRLCPVCRKALSADERYICRGCLRELPRTHYENEEFNAMEQKFAGRVPIERATALFFYEKEHPYASIIHDIKYYNLPGMGRQLAAYAVRQMRESGFFDEITHVTPVPIHRSKLAQRGYNQSDYIARGICDETSAKFAPVLRATIAHSTQTHKNASQRWENISGTIALREKEAAALRGAHILLVDDVITTGSTLVVCAQQLAQIPDVKISVFTLSSTRFTL